MPIDAGRWELAQRLVARWWPPFVDEDRVTEAEMEAAERRLGLKLPASLREWYQWAGRRQDFVGNEDVLVTPEYLAIEDDVLVLCVENAAVVRWGVWLGDLDLTDPPVLADDDGGNFPLNMVRFVIESDRETHVVGSHRAAGPVDNIQPPNAQWLSVDGSISDFMLAMIVEATLFSAPYTGSGPATIAISTAIEREYRRLGSRGRSFANLFADDETFIWLNTAHGTDPWWWMGAHCRTAAERLLHVVGGDSITISHSGSAWGLHTYDEKCADAELPFIVRGGAIERFKDDGLYKPPCHDAKFWGSLEELERALLDIP